MSFWRDKRVLLTGHTGFKGSWLSELLLSRGASVHGLALPPEGAPALFDQLQLAGRLDHAIVDIRDAEAVSARVAEVRPGIVLHLAAQPLVRLSYREPVATWATNVMGTVHLLDALRRLGEPCLAVVVTTDKVYDNREWEHPYRETDPLGGHDPYAASKAGAELVADSYRKSFFSGGGVRLATARAGNVIGGGDWAEDRIVPDLVRAFAAGLPLETRNMAAVRPWQHVLDPLVGYLMLVEALAGPDSGQAQTSFNFGPEPADQRSVGALTEAAKVHWAGVVTSRNGASGPHEAGRLALSIERARLCLGWSPRWDFDRAVAETIGWYKAVAEGADPLALTRAQIAAFEGL